jgi:hypothetical protein
LIFITVAASKTFRRLAFRGPEDKLYTTGLMVNTIPSTRHCAATNRLPSPLPENPSSIGRKLFDLPGSTTGIDGLAEGGIGFMVCVAG